MTTRRRSKRGKVKVAENENEPIPSEPAIVNVNGAGKRKQSFLVRTGTTLAMIFGAVIHVYIFGHFGLYLLGVAAQIVVYWEITNLAYKRHLEEELERNVPFFRTLMWLFLASSMYFSHGFVWRHFLVGTGSHFLSFIAKYHVMISYSIHMSVFVLFVLSLRKGLYKYQLKAFSWTHLVILLIVGPSTLGLSLVFEGLIWYMLTIFLMVTNDVFAYICGFFFGKTPLIKLSPKKTWEGFIGASVFSLFFAVLLSWGMSYFEALVCPKLELALSFPECARDSIFIPQLYTFPSIFSSVIKSINIQPVVFHSLVLAMFGSLIAPFGGFFASAFKRASNIKDFGDSLPGHGGLTDRFDCHVVMHLFCYVYYAYVVRTSYDPGSILAIVATFTPEQQVSLFNTLKDALASQNLI